MDDVTTKVGLPFTVRLGSNPSTGYTWHLTPDDHVEVVEETFEGSAGGPDDDGRVGAGGTQVFTLRAVRTGKAMLTFVHRRAWERDTPPLQVQHLVVRARR